MENSKNGATKPNEVGPLGKEKKKGGLPIGMPIAAVILFILGLIAMPLIENNATEEQLARNVLLSAIPFILIFAAIIIAFMSLIWFAMSKLNDKISPRIYRPIDYILIGGILLGLIFMFQPWIFPLFRIGFFMLLASTIGYILWSHVRPKEEQEQEDLASGANLD